MDRQARGVRADRRDPVPALLIGLWVLLLPIQIETNGVVDRLAPSDLALIAYLIIRLPRLRHEPAAWSGWIYALVAIVGLGLMVAVVRTGAVEKYAVVQKGIGLLVLVVAFLCVVDFCTDWGRLRWLLRLFVLGVTVNALAAVAAALLHDVGGVVVPIVNEGYEGRIAGLLIDPNAFGGLVGVALAVHAITALGRRPLVHGPLMWAASITLPVALSMTYSRSSWLGMAAGIVSLLVLRPRTGGRLLSRLSLPLLLVAPVMAVLLVGLLPNSAELASRPQEVESRVAIGLDAVDEAVANPVLGMGAGVYYAKYDIIVHNTALWFLTEFGLVGLLVFSGFVLSFFAKLLTAERLGTAEQQPLLLALVTAHSVMLGLSLGIEALYQRHWWLVLGCAGAAYAVIRAEVAESADAARAQDGYAR